ncbi:MAG: NADH-quinone oxidoreductase subunit NuoE [Candidatus Tritonobacter lacicola]|nr:NADH-quinone oxidoreductase subunit NuoE [Candidatus Tritonobacter lacicola]
MMNADLIKEVDRIVDLYGGRITGSIGMLQDIQSRYSYLPREALIHVAERLDVPLSQVFSLATFYKAFSLRPRGKHLIVVCMGTACHVRGATRLVDEIGRKLDIKPGETTEDNLFTLEAVNCLGACALGPLMVIDGEYYGNMAPKKVESVLGKYSES